MHEIDLNEVAKNYSSSQKIWQLEDKWHIYNYHKISQFLKQKYFQNYYQNKLILNAGSGGQNYDFPEDNMYHFDLVDINIKDKKNYSTGNIESLPYSNDLFDMILCVGEVINYSDAFKSITEFSRVLKTGGQLILEYESSKTLEFICKKEFNASSVITETFFQGRPERIWYYSENHINNILKEMGFEIIMIERFHILSILAYRITKSSNYSVKFAKLDKLARHIPWIKGCASNVIILARKVM